MLLLAWRSAIPANFFIKRVWLALPFFTGMIILPALFIIPGPALVHLPLGLTITQTGATSGALPAAAGEHFGLPGPAAGADHPVERGAEAP